MKKDVAASAAGAVAPKKPEFSLIDEDLLKSRIYTIRGVKVMLDADLAEIYGYSTKAFNQQVKNNIEKFAEDFRFQLNKDELAEVSRSKNSTLEQEKSPKMSVFGQIDVLRSKNLTTNVSVMSRNATKVFTERGLYMLATILKSERARAVTFAIIETFYKVRSLKRELLQMHEETDKEKQTSMMDHFGELLTDIVMPDLQTSETETHLEINFVVGKLKHTVKRVRKEP